MNRVLKKEKTENKTSVRYFEGLNLWIFAAVFVANIFFQLSEVSSSLFLYVGIFVILLTLFFLDKDDYIYIFISLLSALRVATIFNVSVINIITIVYLFRAYVFENEYKKEKEKRRLPKNVMIACIVYIVYSTMYVLLGVRGLREILYGIKFLCLLVYIVDVFRSMYNNNQAEKKFMDIKVYYVAGTLIAVFSSIMINPSYSLDATRMSLMEGAGVNQLGISLAFCLAFVTLGMTRVTNLKEWAVLAVTALPLLYFCFATQSRTSIIALILIFASTLILGYAQKKARLWITLMLIASVVVFGALIFLADGTQIQENVLGTIERFTNPRGDDLSNGRFDLWQMYIDRLSNDMFLFFFGGTLEDFNGVQAHNMFIEIFASDGLFGTCVILFVYTTVFFEIRKAITSFRKSKKYVLSFLPFILVFVTGMASHTLLNTEPTVNFCMGAAMIYLYGENDSNEDNVADGNDTGVELVGKRKRYKNIRRLDRRYSKKLRRI
ncbi:MAG: O-antigen ligase family protein [Clostridia bacterium]|nr:O-antigen ligase family protein [Clostridia bacterium]